MVRSIVCAVAVLTSVSAAAQEHDHSKMIMTPAQGWQFMQDGVFFEFNDQGGPRGGTEFVAPNWWMLMASRDTSHGHVHAVGHVQPRSGDGRQATATAKCSRPAKCFDGQPHRRSPASARLLHAGGGAHGESTVSGPTGFTITGAAAGDPALGPVAFMHRASAFDNPMAPLSHHTFDSTHVSFGVVTGGVDRAGGRSRDRCSTAANRTNTGGTSTSARSTRCRDVSGSSRTPSGRFRSRRVISSSPSKLEPGNIERTTASASWTRTRGRDVSNRSRPATAATTPRTTDRARPCSSKAPATQDRTRSSRASRCCSLSSRRPRRAHQGVYGRRRSRHVQPDRGLEGGVGADVTCPRRRPLN